LPLRVRATWFHLPLFQFVPVAKIRESVFSYHSICPLPPTLKIKPHQPDAASWDYDQIGFATITGTGSAVLGTSPTLTNPTVTNYVETAFTANSSTAITLALTNGTVQIITLTGNATITMPTAVAGKSFIMFLKQDATGSRTVTWSTVKWSGGTAPTITSTASKQDIFSFFSDGTNWYGTTVGQNYTP